MQRNLKQKSFFVPVNGQFGMQKTLITIYQENRQFSERHNPCYQEPVTKDRCATHMLHSIEGEDKKNKDGEMDNKQLRCK